MGICYLQHRITTGLHVGRILSTGCHSRYTQNVEHNLSDTFGSVFKDGYRMIFYTLLITLYLFILISIFSVASNLNFVNDASLNQNFVQVLTKCTKFKKCDMTNMWVLIILVFVSKLNFPLLKLATKNFGLLLGLKCRKLSLSFKIRFSFVFGTQF